MSSEFELDEPELSPSDFSLNFLNLRGVTGKEVSFIPLFSDLFLQLPHGFTFSSVQAASFVVASSRVTIACKQFQCKNAIKQQNDLTYLGGLLLVRLLGIGRLTVLDDVAAGNLHLPGQPQAVVQVQEEEDEAGDPGGPGRDQSPNSSPQKSNPNWGSTIWTQAVRSPTQHQRMPNASSN